MNKNENISTVLSALNRLIPVFLILLLFCSCSQNDSAEIQHLKVSVDEYTNRFKLMEQEMNTLKEKKNKLDTENSNLISDNYHLQSKNSNLERSLERSKEYSRNLIDDPLFQWVHISDWNNIKIQYDYGKSEIEIPSVKLAPYTFIDSITKGWGPEAMDEGVCNYEFIQNDISYVIEIFQEHVFKYQDVFYYCDNNLFDLYESFIPVSFNWLKTDNIFNLIYHSKIINMRNSYFITDKTKSIAVYIASFQVVVSPPKSNVGKQNDIIKCYNHGEAITISIYDNYLSILYKNVTTWYKGTEEDRPPSGVTDIITAG
ncbi:MAG TPA: hypothetical protein VIK78_09370 [Ruminiclostridium sp.]